MTSIFAVQRHLFCLPCTSSGSGSVALHKPRRASSLDKEHASSRSATSHPELFRSRAGSKFNLTPEHFGEGDRPFLPSRYLTCKAEWKRSSINVKGGIFSDPLAHVQTDKRAAYYNVTESIAHAGSVKCFPGSCYSSMTHDRAAWQL